MKLKKVALLILAAGEARRFGVPKQLLEWGNSTILGTIIDEALESNFYKIFVVLGAYYNDIKERLESKLNKTTIINNKNWKEGMFSSIKKGLETVLNKDIDYVMFQLGDMPFIKKDIFNKFIEAADSGYDFVIAENDNRPAHPYMIRKTRIREILRGNFKNGMRDVITKEFSTAYKINVNNVVARQDIDTWEIYEKLKKN